MSRPETTGLVLFAHGARDPRWAAPFEHMCAQLRQLHSGLPVRAAYLDFLPPTLSQAVAELVELGCRSVVVVPMFLGAGGHVRKDLPEMVAALRAEHPRLDLRVARSIGEDAQVLQAMSLAALRAVQDGEDA
jgi:sirohydrochlorin cobaltochelatase